MPEKTFKKILAEFDLKENISPEDMKDNLSSYVFCMQETLVILWRTHCKILRDKQSNPEEEGYPSKDDFYILKLLTEMFDRYVDIKAVTDVGTAAQTLLSYGYSIQSPCPEDSES